MEVYMIFLWLQLACLAIQMGFIVGGLLKKDINLSVVFACAFLSFLMLAGVIITKP